MFSYCLASSSVNIAPALLGRGVSVLMMAICLMSGWGTRIRSEPPSEAEGGPEKIVIPAGGLSSGWMGSCVDSES